MKKLAAILMGAAVIMTLAACTPTPEKQMKQGDMPVQTSEEVAPKVPDKNAIPMEVMSVYYINDEGTALEKTMDAVEGDSLTAQAVVDKLAEYSIMEDDTEVLSFDIKDDIATLDVSKMPSLSPEEEKLILMAVGNTFIENYEDTGVAQLKLLVNGQNYSSENIQQGDTDYFKYNKKYKEKQ